MRILRLVLTGIIGLAALVAALFFTGLFVAIFAGFAVVAAEVRSLAHQSAESARDISRLVTESRERMATLAESLARLDKADETRDGATQGRQAA